MPASPEQVIAEYVPWGDTAARIATALRSAGLLPSDDQVVVPREPSPQMVEAAAKASYEGPDELGRERVKGATWEAMLSFGGREPENREHPLADEHRRIARAALSAALSVHDEKEET